MNKGVIGIIGTAVGAIAGAVVANQLSEKKGGGGQNSENADRFKNYYNMLNHWLILKQQGKSIAQYFANHGYKKIAIYGMGEMGDRFYDEIKSSEDVEVKYAVDKNAAKIYSEVEIFKPDENLPSADVIVVTAIYAYDEIEMELKEKLDCAIVSLEEVIYEVI